MKITDQNAAIELLKNKVKIFCEERDWDQFHSPEQLAIGVSTEASELLSIFRFKTPKQINEIINSSTGIENISDEIADVLFFLLRMCQMLNIDLATALENKITKNQIKYPVEISKGSNLKYSERL